MDEELVMRPFEKQVVTFEIDNIDDIMDLCRELGGRPQTFAGESDVLCKFPRNRRPEILGIEVTDKKVIFRQYDRDVVAECDNGITFVNLPGSNLNDVEFMPTGKSSANGLIRPKAIDFRWGYGDYGLGMYIQE